MRSTYCRNLWAGAAKYRIWATKRLTGDPDLVKTNLQNQKHRRRAASLLKISKIHLRECARESNDLIPSPFHQRKFKKLHKLHKKKIVLYERPFYIIYSYKTENAICQKAYYIYLIIVTCTLNGRPKWS